MFGGLQQFRDMSGGIQKHAIVIIPKSNDWFK
jgi:hypothetical protein